MDSAELFGETHSVGEVVAGGLFRAYSSNRLIHLTGNSVELQGFSDLISHSSTYCIDFTELSGSG